MRRSTAVRRRAPVRRRRLVSRARPIPAEMMAARRRRTATPRRNAKGQFVRSSATRRPVIRRRVMRAMPVPAGMEARKRRRPAFKSLTHKTYPGPSRMYRQDGLGDIDDMNPLNQDEFDAEGSQAARPAAAMKAKLVTFAARRRRAMASMSLDPAKFAALEINEAMLARRRRKTVSRRRSTVVKRRRSPLVKRRRTVRRAAPRRRPRAMFGF